MFITRWFVVKVPIIKKQIYRNILLHRNSESKKNNASTFNTGSSEKCGSALPFDFPFLTHSYFLQPWKITIYKCTTCMFLDSVKNGPILIFALKVHILAHRFIPKKCLLLFITQLTRCDIMGLEGKGDKSTPPPSPHYLQALQLYI